MQECVRSTAWPVLALAVPFLAAALLPAVAQWQSYHDFADQRTLLGIPHGLNVLSNLPFLAVGALGVGQLRRGTHDRAVIRTYGLFFAGALLTAFGSAWYHLDPRDSTLVWDRLPIALGFAGLVAATLADRQPRRAALYSAAFAVVGVAAVLHWAWSGNLLPYLLVQASFMAAALFVTARVPSLYTHARWLYGAAALYGMALVCERLDKAIESVSGGLSGHTLKHLLAALGLCVIYEMLRRRKVSCAQ